MNQAVNLYSYVQHNNRRKPIKALSLLAGLFFSISFGYAQQDLRGIVQGGELRGVIVENDPYDGLPLPYHYGQVEKLPLAVDMKPFLPRIVTQMYGNTSAAWSVVWYGHTILEAKARNISSDAPGHRALPLAPAFTNRDANKQGTCDDPASMIKLLESLTTVGAPRFSTLPELCTNEALLPAQYDSARKHKLGGFTRLFNTYDPQDLKVHAVKKALAEGSPVPIAFICPPSFQYATAFWQPREEPNLKEQGLHSVCVIGYDDSKFGGAFQVANSWGLRWADKGTTWFRYADFGKFAHYAFQLTGAFAPMAGAVKLLDGKGVVMPVEGLGNGRYRFTKTYATGDQIRIQLSMRKALYCAVIVVDASNQPAVIFPAKDASVPFVSDKLSLPNDSDYFTLTEPAGKNLIHVVFSMRYADMKAAVDAIVANKKFTPSQPGRVSWDNGDMMFESRQETVVVTAELLQK